jgi:hypothetical protein
MSAEMSSVKELMLNEYETIQFNIKELSEAIQKLKMLQGTTVKLELERQTLEKSASRLYLRITRISSN